jgi:methylphosphotriester-DNA--protein-cysteine methyltransferase
MKLYIKNMVCSRCKAIVRTELDKLGVLYNSVELGEVTIEEKLTKTAIVDLERCSDEDLKTSYSDFISLSVNDSFISLNTLFSEIEGITIEKYIIKRKIELVKELLGHNNLNLAEIAVKMHYSNVAQLSGQFKSMTGLTPLHFRQLRHISNNNLAVN